MTPITFLKERLEKLAVAFPQVQIRYAYNYSIATHVVELTPEVEYYHNERLDNAWIPVSMEFNEVFPAESISFISSDSSLAITKPEMEWNVPMMEWDMLTMNGLFNPILHHSSFQLQLPKTFARRRAANAHIAIESIHTEYIQITNLTEILTVQALTERSSHFHFNEEKKEVNVSGNTQYAMAA